MRTRARDYAFRDVPVSGGKRDALPALVQTQTCPESSSAGSDAENVRVLLKEYPSTAAYVAATTVAKSSDLAARLVKSLDMDGMKIPDCAEPRPLQLLRAICDKFGDIMAARCPL